MIIHLDICGKLLVKFFLHILVLLSVNNKLPCFDEDKNTRQ